MLNPLINIVKDRTRTTLTTSDELNKYFENGARMITIPVTAPLNIIDMVKLARTSSFDNSRF